LENTTEASEEDATAEVSVENVAAKASYNCCGLGWILNPNPEVSRTGMSEDEIREAFKRFDTNGNGAIDPKELKAAMQSLGFEANNQMIYEMISDFDKDGNSSIDIEEFADLMIHIQKFSTSLKMIRQKNSTRWW